MQGVEETFQYLWINPDMTLKHMVTCTKDRGCHTDVLVSWLQTACGTVAMLLHTCWCTISEHNK